MEGVECVKAAVGENGVELVVQGVASLAGLLGGTGEEDAVAGGVAEGAADPVADGVADGARRENSVKNAEDRDGMENVDI